MLSARCFVLDAAKGTTRIMSVSSGDELSSLSGLAQADIEKVIEIACELRRTQADRLSFTDVRDVGLQVGLKPALIEEAVRTLVARRQAREMLRRRLRRWAVFLVLGLLVCGVFGVGCLTVWADQVRAQHTMVLRSASQVSNVLARQKFVRSRYQSRPSDQERDAMLDGAENRVRIEMRRYDDMVERYNSLLAKAHLRLGAFWVDLPASMPLSNQREDWIHVRDQLSP